MSPIAPLLISLNLFMSLLIVSLEYFTLPALMGELAKNIQAHWLEAFSHLGRPQQIKADNGPACTAWSTQGFLQRWGVQLKTGILHSSTGQAVVEYTPLKLLTNTKGSQETSRNLII